MKKRTSLLLALGLAFMMALTGCGESEGDKPEKEKVSLTESMVSEISEEDKVVEEAPLEEESEAEDDENHEGKYRSELTGLWIDEELKDQRPIAVMVDNEKKALQHYQTALGDVVYEIMNSTANDRITRLMVLVKDWGKITQMGSVRSTRPTNILLAAEWNAVLCHDGGPFYIDPYLANDYAAHFSGGFARVKNGKPTEFTEYICTGDLDKKFSASHYSTTYDKYYPGEHYKFADKEFELEDGKSAVSVSLPFKHNGSKLKYNESTGTYDYYEYGELHTDADSGAALTFKNVLIQKCSFHQYDENGYLIYNCIDGNQDGYYLTNGKAIPVKWIKTSDTDPTRYYTEGGEEITLNPGKTYVTLVPDDSWKSMEIS